MKYKCALITGATGGLGRELCRRAAADGLSVVMLDRDRKAMLQFAKESGIPPRCYAVDLKDFVRLEKTLRLALKENQTIDLVIANAGIDVPASMVAPDWRIIQDHLSINTIANGVVLSVVVPHMVAQKRGHFVATASLAALQGFPYEGPYCASKAALRALMDSARAELAPLGLRFTTVHPGFLATPMVKGNAFKVTSTMTAEHASQKIWSAIVRGRRRIYFPIGPYLGTILLNHLPAWLADRLIHTAMKPASVIFPEPGVARGPTRRR